MGENRLHGVGKNAPPQTKVANPNDLPDRSDAPPSGSRRKFLGNVSGVAVAAVTAGAIGLEPLLGGKESVADASVVPYSSEGREDKSFKYRVRTANAEKIDVGQQPDNGDATRFTDFSGSYSKASLHDALGVPNAASWLSLKHALIAASSKTSKTSLLGRLAGDPTRSTMDHRVPLHSTWKASTPMPPSSHQRRASPARIPRPRRSSTTGALCCATCRSPNIRRIRWLLRRLPT